MRFNLAMAALGCSVLMAGASPFAGDWGLASPDNGAVWMRVAMVDGKPDVRMMWEINLAEPVKQASFEQDTLVVVRPYEVWHMTTKGMRRDVRGVDTLRATVTEDAMRMSLDRTLTDGTVQPRRWLSGRRSRPLPPRPDLNAVRFGEPLALFDGKSLSGWRLTRPTDNNAWSAADGILRNAPELEDGPNARQFGNLRTDREFEDFRLTLNVRIPQGGNSGIYLRGRYEVQVADTHGRPPSWGGIGGIYGRIVPLENASRPAGEWQTFDIMLVDRHVTVRLNDRLVIDNQPLEGCTGGALCADDGAPGPIYLQGDHSAIEYREILLFPRIK